MSTQTGSVGAFPGYQQVKDVCISLTTVWGKNEMIHVSLARSHVILGQISRDLSPSLLRSHSNLVRFLPKPLRSRAKTIGCVAKLPILWEELAVKAELARAPFVCRDGTSQDWPYL